MKIVRFKVSKEKMREMNDEECWTNECVIAWANSGLSCTEMRFEGTKYVVQRSIQHENEFTNRWWENS